MYVYLFKNNGLFVFIGAPLCSSVLSCAQWCSNVLNEGLLREVVTGLCSVKKYNSLRKGWRSLTGKCLFATAKCCLFLH